MKKLQIRILKKILHNQCPTRIPRSGDEGKSVNCYSVSLYAGDIPLLLVDEISDKCFIGSYYEGGRFQAKVSLPFFLMYGVAIRIEHYHGLITHIYSGIFDYVWHEWTALYKLQSLLAIAKHSIPQFFFNKKTLQLPSRMAILEKIILKQSVEPNKTFRSLDMMTYVYGMRWYLHPKKTEVRKRMDLYLESFVASGELSSQSSFEYKITGKAVATLEKYQIEVARAKTEAWNQGAIVVLTVVLVLFTGFQAGVLETSYKINLDEIWHWLKSHI